MKQLNNRSPYEILGVPQDASLDDIKAAYKKLAKIHHPDRKGGNAEMMADINWAYELLNDPDKRAHFDRFGYEETAHKITEVEEGILRIWGDMIVRANFKPSSDFIEDIRREIKPMMAPLVTEVITTNKTLPKLKLLRERIRRKDGRPNTIFHMHLDKTIAAAEDHIKECERKIAVHQKQIKYLDDFEFKWDKPAEQEDAIAFAGLIMGTPVFPQQAAGQSFRPRKPYW